MTAHRKPPRWIVPRGDGSEIRVEIVDKVLDIEPTDDLHVRVVDHDATGDRRPVLDHLSPLVACQLGQALLDASAWCGAERARLEAKRPIAVTTAPLGRRGHTSWCMSIKGDTGACDCDGDSEDEIIERDERARREARKR